MCVPVAFGRMHKQKIMFFNAALDAGKGCIIYKKAPGDWKYVGGVAFCVINLNSCLAAMGNFEDIFCFILPFL